MEVVLGSEFISFLGTTTKRVGREGERGREEEGERREGGGREG